MSTAAALNDRPKTELANLARRRGIRGWETMNKGDLVKALARTAPSSPKVGSKAPTVKAEKGKSPRLAPAKPPTKPVSRIASLKPVKPVVKAVAKAVAVEKPAAKAPKAIPKPLPKPAAKSAAKVTRPVPAKPAIAAKPAVNGTHRPTPATIANGTPKPTANGAPKPVVKPVTKSLSVPAKPIKPALSREPMVSRPSTGPQAKDRVFLAVNDPYWLHVMWDLSANSVQRAEAALRQDWYGAQLIIRLFDVTSGDTTSTFETPIRDIPIESDGRNWYVNVPQPPRQYRADIGYKSRRGDFFPLAKSNIVTPPKAGSAEALDAGWEKDPKKAERILAMSTGFESSSHPELKELFEERLGRPLGAPKETAFGSGATPPGSMKKFFFEIHAELFVYVKSDPTAHVTLGNDPIKLNQDGTFAMRFALPDSRQIIPAVATSADGVEERTIVLAVERNTKYLDPMIHDQMTEG